MSVIRSVPRVLVLLVSAIFIATCSSQGAGPDPGPDGGPDAIAPGGGSAHNRGAARCGTTGMGHASPNNPVVCVDDTGATLTVHPDRITVHDVGRADSKAVIIQWVTRSGRNDLQVEIAEGCVTAVECRTPGKCMARTTPHRGGETADRRCKYDVWTDKHPRLDPDVVITKCCTVPEPTP